MNKSWLKVLLVACVGLFGASLAMAEDEPSGSIQIVSKSVALGVGVTWGKGTITYKGKAHAFSVKGLTVVDLGISKVRSEGEVFHLDHLKDFAGHYVAAAAGAVAARGPDDIILRNDHDVVLRLRGEGKGVRLQLGAEGVNIEMK